MSSNYKLTIFVLFTILQLTCQFSMENTQSDLSKRVVNMKADYQLLLDEPMKLKLLKMEENELKVKATINTPCQPASFEVYKQNIVVDVEEDTNSYVVSVVCKNNEFVNYIYQVDQGTVKKMVEQQSQRSRVRLLATNDTVTCGNGKKEGDEACDDGNNLPGDGCAADCTLECGNGVIDSDLEECDDGNRDGNDGCNPQCKKQGKSMSGAIIAASGATLGVVAIVASQAASSGVGAVAAGMPLQQPGGALIQVGQSVKMMNIGSGHNRVK